MKYFIIFLLSIFLTINAVSQIKNIHSINILERKENPKKEKFKNDSDNYKSIITSGIGFTYLTKSNEPIRFLFSLYSYLNLRFITKYIYLGLGTDVFSEPKYAVTTRITLNVIPTIGINLFKNKISAFIGGGLCIYTFPLSGSIFLFRADYNLNDKISIGLDIKRPYFGDQEFRDNTLLLNHINISLKF